MTYIKDRLSVSAARATRSSTRTWCPFRTRQAGVRRPKALATQDARYASIGVRDPRRPADVSHLKAAFARWERRMFMSAASPGVALLQRHYPTEEAYIFAIADAMRHSTRPWPKAGIVLQLDAPIWAWAATSTRDYRRQSGARS